jgi:uncharacterized protein (DUF433 family)
MPAFYWSQCPAVESIPGDRSGAWFFRGTRTPVSVVFDNLEVGASSDEIMKRFHLSREQIQAVLEFAARSLDPLPVSVGAADLSAEQPTLTELRARLH